MATTTLLKSVRFFIYVAFWLCTSCRQSDDITDPTILPIKQWDKTFGGNGSDFTSSIIATADGGYLLSGYSASDVTGDKSESSHNKSFDYWLVKTDANGQKQWDKTLGGRDRDEVKYLINTADGGYLIAGDSPSLASFEKSENPCSASVDFWIVKVGQSGQKQWDKTYGGGLDDHISYILATSDGGYLLVGDSSSGISCDKSESYRYKYLTNRGNGWILKIDNRGQKQWDKTLGGERSDYFNSAVETADGGFLLAGSSSSPISGDKSAALKGQSNFPYPDYWLVKVTATGQKIWDKSFGGNQVDQLETLIPAANGNFLLAGTSDSDISGDKTGHSRNRDDYWVVMVNSNGDKLWDKTYGSGGFDILKAGLKTDDGGFLLAGWSDGAAVDKSEPPRGSRDYWLVKIDADGNKQWDKTLGGNDIDELSSIAKSQDGGYVAFGKSRSPVSGEKTQPTTTGVPSDNYWIVKLK